MDIEDIEEELKTKEIPLLEILSRIEDIDPLYATIRTIERANSRPKGILMIPIKNKGQTLQIGFYKNSLNENICTLEVKFLDELLKEYGNFRNAIV
jgi:hypothetical protein